MGSLARRKRPMEILMVEDSLMCARITMSGLRRSEIRHRLTWLKDGASALDFLFRRKSFTRAPRPDVILLDLGLPVLDGRDVLAEIKAHEDLCTIPVVVLTGSSDKDDAVDCQLLGVEGFLTKPVDLDKFSMLVRELSHHWHEDVMVPVFN
ncbi:MAG: response regulator [Planctomycetota bacterium]|nr:MAG: response regulator [Planctomycetota bacterium]REJ94941.1 MAG: response regulator [Planctomycetota bacterium]REK22431.1 MAG: response regulator [Planctomycetota bacterium]REK34919.1 MAG: response regulator [Planctomycetota bacterium]